MKKSWRPVELRSQANRKTRTDIEVETRMGIGTDITIIAHLDTASRGMRRTDTATSDDIVEIEATMSR